MKGGQGVICGDLVGNNFSRLSQGLCPLAA